MLRGTLADALAWTDAGVYVVRRCRKCPALYVGSTAKGVGWRLKRHLNDGSKQECSKLSGTLRRNWPFSQDWTVEAWSVREIECKTAARRGLTLRSAEVAMQRLLRPSLCSVDGVTPDKPPEQLTLWAK